MQPGERQRRLGLETLRGQHPHAGGAGTCVLEQGRLADAGFAPDQQRAGRARTGVSEQRGHPRPLSLSAVQHLPKLLRNTPTAGRAAGCSLG